jgi:hypothetical protein
MAMDEPIAVPDLETREAPGAFLKQRRRLLDGILIGRREDPGGRGERALPSDDSLAAARGILLGLAISAVLWAVIGAAVWAILV